MAPLSGATPSERYLQQLGRKSFLSLWSHGNPYTPEGRRGGIGVGNELCDLLVVFGNDVVIFSDKHITFNHTIDLKVAWSRWYKKAVEKSAKQIFGAEAWLRKFPNKVYADPECSCLLPVAIPSASEIRVHRVCVALGAYEACRDFFGGGSLGTLMIDAKLNGIAEHLQPFRVGHPLLEKGFVHVFDKFALNAVLSELDTAKDLIAYLGARELFLSQKKPIVLAAGEEQLLAVYLTNVNEEGNHAFLLPVESKESPDIIFLDESFWASMVSSGQWTRKKEADQVSYVWDRLIEHFIAYGKDEEGRSENLERAYRFMASEPRIRRRQLGHALRDFMQSTLPRTRAVRLVYSNNFPEKTYVFLVVPLLQGQEYSEYREQRKNILFAYCQVAKLRCEHTSFVIGIAMDPRGSKGGSEDFVAIDVSGWGEAELEDARVLQRGSKLLLDENVRVREGRTLEYPSKPQAAKAKGKNDNARTKNKKKQRSAIQRASRKKNRKKH